MNRINAREMVVVSLFAALTAVGAFVKVPFFPVSFTFQTFFCAMSACLLRKELAALSQLVYVAVGLAGLPIFANGGGFFYIFQPSFGFLVGLIFAAYIVAWVLEAAEGKRNKAIWRALAFAAGAAALYAFGLTYMGVILNAYMGRGVSLWYIVKNGFLIFLPGDVLKIALSSVLVGKILPYKSIIMRERY